MSLAKAAKQARPVKEFWDSSDDARWMRVPLGHNQKHATAAATLGLVAAP